MALPAVGCLFSFYPFLIWTSTYHSGLPPGIASSLESPLWFPLVGFHGSSGLPLNPLPIFTLHIGQKWCGEGVLKCSQLCTPYISSLDRSIHPSPVHLSIFYLPSSLFLSSESCTVFGICLGAPQMLVESNGSEFPVTLIRGKYLFITDTALPHWLIFSTQIRTYL